MPLAVVAAEVEEVDVSMTEDMQEDVGEEVDDAEEDTTKEVVEEAAAHMEMVLTYHMSPVTLKMQSRTHYQKKQKNYNRGPSMQ